MAIDPKDPGTRSIHDLPHVDPKKLHEELPTTNPQLIQYSVHDELLGEDVQHYFMANDAVAFRAFEASLQDQSAPQARHPANHKLRRCGRKDLVSGRLTPEDPRDIAHAKDLINGVPDPTAGNLS